MNKNIDINDTVLFTDDLYWNNRIGKIKAVYLKGTIGENYKIESNGKIFNNINIHFVDKI